MQTRADKSELVKAEAIGRMLGLTAREVRRRAAGGKIPGAYCLDGTWRFDEGIIRAWREKQRVKLCPSTNGQAAAPGGSAFKPKVAKSGNRLEQLLGLRP